MHDGCSLAPYACYAVEGTKDSSAQYVDELLHGTVNGVAKRDTLPLLLAQENARLHLPNSRYSLGKR